MAKAEKLTASTVEASSNGHGPRSPKHLAWIAIPDYAGMEVQAWTNAPQRLFLDLDSGDAERIGSSIRQLIVATRTVWDGTTFDSWFDCDGEPLPQPSDPTFLDAVPTELLAMALVAIRRDGGTILPNLAARSKAR